MKSLRISTLNPHLFPRGRSALFAAGLAVALATSLLGEGTSVQKTLTHDQVGRSYNIYTPSSYTPNDPMPLVLNFHGFTGSADQQMNLSGMNAVAENEGFLVAYPDAVDGDWGAGGDHNLSFTDALLEDIHSQFTVDRSRIYSTGMSQGGIMSYTLGAARPDVFAAVASVTGTRMLSRGANLFPGFVPNTPQRPMPLMHIHGTSDVIVPYDGGNTAIPGLEFIEFPPVRAVMDEWAASNGCSNLGTPMEIADTDDTDGSTVSRFNYQNCDKYITQAGVEQTAEVIHFRVEGGGHSWPVDTAARPPFSEEFAWQFSINSDIVASEEVWDFFSRHQLPAVGSQSGDFDGNSLLDFRDIDLLSTEIRKPTGQLNFDLNGDETVDQRDHRLWVEGSGYANTFLGDADLNKTVDFADFLQLSVNFNQMGGWAEGDFDGNGLVEFPDFLALSANFEKGASTIASSVPEPNGISLAIFGTAGLLGVRRRR